MHTSRQAVAVSAMLVLVGTFGDPPHAPAPVSTDLAFEMTVGEATDIYRIKVDGTGLERLTTVGGFNFNAAWSPDGARIAFSSHRDGEGAIYVMNADGSDQLRLTVGLDAWQPVWSPDGTKILFVSLGYVDGVYNVDVYVMNADGSQRVRLTTTAGGDFEPSWSPDSRKIAFSSQRNGREEIYIINADGTGEHRLHAAEASVGSEQYPAWSPDGTKIAFTVIYAFGSEDIFVANADGSGMTQLAPNGEQPVWSPDGSTIAFTRLSDCSDYGCPTGELFTVTANGSSVTQLTWGGYSEQIAWSRDGSWIAFHAYSCAESDDSCGEFMRLVRPDGSQLTTLATGAAGPAWRP